MPVESLKDKCLAYDKEMDDKYGVTRSSFQLPFDEKYGVSEGSFRLPFYSLLCSIRLPLWQYNMHILVNKGRPSDVT